MKVEDNHNVYRSKESFLRLPTSFSKSVRYEVLSFVCLTVIKMSWVQGGGSHAIILLVSPLVSLTIAKFSGLNVHCFCSSLFSFVRILISCPYIIVRGQST